jgi:hypothetical protein
MQEKKYKITAIFESEYEAFDEQEVKEILENRIYNILDEGKPLNIFDDIEIKEVL